MACTAPNEVPFFFCLFQRRAVGCSARHRQHGKSLNAPWFILRNRSTPHFCKMHGAVYGTMHGPVYGRFHDSMHAVVYMPMHGAVYAFRSEIHCTWSFTPIYKNQCTWSFTTFFGILRPVAIGRKEGKRAFYVAENPPGAGFYPVKSWPVAACIASAFLSCVIYTHCGRTPKNPIKINL